MTSHLPTTRSSEITLVDVTSGEAFRSARDGAVLLSSSPFGWRGILVEWQRLAPQELPEHYVVGHGMTVSTGRRPIPFGWKDGGKWREGVMNPGDFHLLAHGDLNTPRWLRTFDEVSLVLDPSFVADIVKDGLPPERVEFVTQRSARDPTITRYIDAFRAELASDSSSGLLYADALTVGFVLHLLSRYAVSRPRIPSPRGKLNSYQLRTVVDFIQSHLAEDVSLVVLATQANVSPFHFARLFRETIGWTPHQFVMRQRVHKSLVLMKEGRMPLAQVATEAGFHDQAHFTRAFRKVMGAPPGTYIRRP